MVSKYLRTYRRLVCLIFMWTVRVIKPHIFGLNEAQLPLHASKPQNNSCDDTYEISLVFYTDDNVAVTLLLTPRSMEMCLQGQNASALLEHSC